MLRIYGFDSDCDGFDTIDGSLKSMQEYVGGLITVVRLTDDIDLVANDEGILLQLEPRVGLLDSKGRIADIIVGDCFLCRHDDNGNFTDINKSDLPFIKKNLVWLDLPTYILHKAIFG